MNPREQLDIENDFLAEDAEAEAPTDNQLASIAELGRRLTRQRQVVEDLTSALNTATEQYVDLAERTIPEAMLGIGLRDFQLADGRRIEVVDVLHWGIPKARRPEAFDWLRAHDQDGIIKTEVIAEFKKGEAARAKHTLTLLEQNGVAAVMADDVHHQTLGKWIREMRALVAKGEADPTDAPPDELFGVYTRTVANLTSPAAPKTKLPTPRKTPY